jgi:hypothetical protein
MPAAASGLAIRASATQGWYNGAVISVPDGDIVMPSRRAPWWMYVVAASYVGFVALFFYQLFTGPPILPGFEGRFISGGMAVLSVHPGSPEARAGLEEGDRVLAVNGQVIRNLHDWEAIRANTEIGRPERWQIARAYQRLDLRVAVPRLSWRERLSTATISVCSASQ